MFFLVMHQNKEVNCVYMFLLVASTPACMLSFLSPNFLLHYLFLCQLQFLVLLTIFLCLIFLFLMTLQSPLLLLFPLRSHPYTLIVLNYLRCLFLLFHRHLVLRYLYLFCLPLFLWPNLLLLCLLFLRFSMLILCKLEQRVALLNLRCLWLSLLTDRLLWIVSSNILRS